MALAFRFSPALRGETCHPLPKVENRSTRLSPCAFQLLRWPHVVSQQIGALAPYSTPSRVSSLPLIPQNPRPHAKANIPQLHGQRGSIASASAGHNSSSSEHSLAKLENEVSIVNPTRSNPLGGPSVELLSISGAGAIVFGVFAVPALVPLTPLLERAVPLPAVLAVMSYAHGLFLSRFDLNKLGKLRLTVTVAVIMRLATTVLLALPLSVLAAQLTAVAQPPLSAAPAVTSLLLFIIAPVGISPSVAVLSNFIYPTLYAHIALLTMLLLPFLPPLAFALHAFALHLAATPAAASVALLHAGRAAFPSLLLSTTVPTLLAVATSRTVSRRRIAQLGLTALPVAWACAGLLTASGLRRALCTVAPAVTFFPSFAATVCTSVALMMLTHAGANAVGLDVRAQRTLALYVYSQGTSVAAATALADNVWHAMPLVVATLVGVATTAIQARRWKRAVTHSSLERM